MSRILLTLQEPLVRVILHMDDSVDQFTDFPVWSLPDRDAAYFPAAEIPEINGARGRIHIGTCSRC